MLVLVVRERKVVDNLPWADKCQYQMENRRAIINSRVIAVSVGRVWFVLSMLAMILRCDA